MAGNHDGKVTISTALDNRNIEKDLKNISGEFGGLEKSLGNITKTISGAMTKPVNAACAKIQKDIDTAKKKIDQYQTQIQNTEQKRNPLVEQSKQLGSELDTAKRKLAELQTQQQAVKDTLSGTGNADAYIEAYAQKPGIDAAVTTQQAQVDSLQKKWDSINNRIDGYNRKIDQATQAMSGQKATVAELNKKLDATEKETKNINKNVSNTKNGFGSVSKSVKSFGTRLKSIALGAFVFNVISSALRKFVDTIGSAVTSTNEMQGAIANLKGAASVAFAPAMDIISKALARLTNALATAISYIAHFVSLISGKGISEMKEMAKGMSSTAKSAEKAKKSIAGFDEITMLSDSSGSSDAPGMNYDFVEDSLQGSEEIKQIMNDLKKDILKGNWFGAGETLGQAIMDGIMSVDWASLGANIGGILGDILSFALGLALSIDPFQLVGAINGFVGGLFQSLAEKIQMLDWEDIGGKLVKALLFGVLMADPSTAILTILFSPNSDKLMSGAAELIGSIIGALVKAVIGMAKEIGRIGQEIWNTLKGYFDEYVDWEGTPGEIIAGLFNGIIDALKNVGTWIKENIFTPFIEGFCEAFDINSPAGEMKEPGKNIIFGMLEGILTALKSIGTWIEENIFDPFMEAFKAAFGINGNSSEEMEGQGGNLITSLLSGIRTAWTSIPGFFTEAFETVKRKLKEIWENGIVPAIKKPVNSIIGYINSMISGVVTGINSVIRALNRISFSIPDWDIFGSLAGKKFGFSFTTITAPQIPYLAQGAVLPANKPFLAMVGDQRHGTNVEAPLATIQEAVALVMDDMIASNMAGQEMIVGVLRELLEAVLGIRIGDEVIGRAVQRYNQKRAVMYGGTL